MPELVDDRCPNCGKSLEADAVVCMSCGYDMKANEVLRPRTGVDEIEPPPVRPDFVKPGGTPMSMAIAGGCVTLAAMVASARNAPAAGPMGTSLALAVLVLYFAIVHTGTGLAGLWCASRFVEHRLNRPVLAATRMFLALAVFLLVWSLRLPIESEWLERTLRLPQAALAYWLALFMLFRRSRQETTLIAFFHLGAMLIVQFAIQVPVWLETSMAGAPSR